MIKTISKLERLRHTRNGNPRWRVTFTDGTVMQTRADSNVAAMLDNSEYRDVPLRIQTDGAGRLWQARPATAQEVQA